MSNLCHDCPRNCGLDREVIPGFCGEKNTLRLANAGLHFGEEPIVSGSKGSGTIFFTGCQMRCPHCQNWQISRGKIGKTVTAEEFLDICTLLEDAGAENINLVTPSHFISTLKPILARYKAKENSLPILWNNSGYESLASIQKVHPFIDVYLSDLKTLDAKLAGNIYSAPDYPEKVKDFLVFAAKERPLLVEKGLIHRGVIVRHLILPGYLKQTEAALKWFSENLKEGALLSLMAQYTPVKIPGDQNRFVPDRELNQVEYDAVMEMLDKYGIDNGFVQDLEPGSQWLPDFNKKTPFLTTLAKTLWPVD